MEESSQPTAKVFTLKGVSHNKIPIGHEFDCGDTALILFEDPNARVLHPDVPDARGGIVRARCENVTVQLKYV